MRAEGGGWGDAVMPLISPNGTAGEWFEDPYGTLGYTFSGPGEFSSSYYEPQYGN
jgi:phospholipase C